MKPVLTVAEMRAADAAADASHEELVRRAGWAVARSALQLLGGGYGRRVLVVAGPGSNGADGRVAATALGRRGARVQLVDAGDAASASRLARAGADLVVDAAYGTGLRDAYDAPDVGSVPVLAVDVPSGIAGDSGASSGTPVRAVRTVTFAALKPGLLLGDGPEHAGSVEVADIGVDPGSPSIHLVEDADVAATLPGRRRQDHKWHSAVYVVAGTPGMMGAARFAADAAMRAGAGTVRLGTPGSTTADHPPSEVVGRLLPKDGWGSAVVEDAARAMAAVVGPGLGRDETTATEMRRLLAALDVPLVLDADGLSMLGDVDVLRDRSAPTVLTPHEGEFERLVGSPPSADRIGDTRRLAERTGCVVLLKGPSTVVAGPDGAVRLVTAGSPRLATAGSGDVLAGVIGAFLARGVAPLDAAALGAHVHGRAADRGRSWGLIASDLLDLVADHLSATAGREA